MALRLILAVLLLSVLILSNVTFFNVNVTVIALLPAVGLVSLISQYRSGWISVCGSLRKFYFLLFIYAAGHLLTEAYNGSLNLMSVVVIINQSLNWLWLPVLVRISRSIKNLRVLNYTCVLCGVYVFVIWITILCVTKDLFGAQHIIYTPLYEFTIFFNPNILSMHALFVFFLMSIGIPPLRFRKRLVLQLLFALIITSTLSRASSLALALYSFLAYVILPLRRRHGVATLALCLVSVIGVFLVSHVSEVRSRFYKSLSQIEFVLKTDEDLMGTSHRLRMLNAVFEIISDRPLTGVGFNEVSDALMRHGSSKVMTGKGIQVHGELLFIFIMGGAFLLLLFSLPLMYVFYYALTRVGRNCFKGLNRRYRLLFCMYFISVIPTLFSYTFGKLTVLQLQFGIVGIGLLTVRQYYRPTDNLLSKTRACYVENNNPCRRD